MKTRGILSVMALFAALLASSATAQTVTYNADDQLSTETYDANGNTLTTGGKTFAYDSENHLVSMNGGAVTLSYDGDGNLISKTINGVTTKFLIDDMNPMGLPQVMEEIVNGAVQRRYSFGRQRVSQTQLVNNSWVTSVYGYDGQGNVRQLTNAAGVVTDTYDYDAFGNLINRTGTTPNNYLYRGELYDPDLGLCYLRARWYNPVTGRFLSRDPVSGSPRTPASLHKYNYASSDPVNRTDPGGREDAVETGGATTIGLGASAAVTYVGLRLVCQLQTQGAVASAVTQPDVLGSPQDLQILGSICSAISSKVPGTPLGPYPAPFYPDEKWAMTPGNPWTCEGNAEGRITFCKRPCPDGGEEWFTWDPGTKYGEPPHWDVHLCNNTTCKIYTDGTSTCPPGTDPPE